MVEINKEPCTWNKHTENLRNVVGKGHGHKEANVHQRLYA